MTTENELLSTKEAAALLGVKVQTLAVWRCKKRHSLKYIKAKGYLRYRRRDIEQFLNEHIVTSEPIEVRRRVRR